MGYLVGILAALAAHGLVESGYGSAIAPVWLAPGLVLVPYLAARLVSGLGGRGRFQAAARVARGMELLPPLLHYLALGPLGWQATVEGFVGEPISLLEWPRLSFLLLLAPFVVYTLALIDAQARSQGRGDLARDRVRRFQMRMFASALAPVLAYVTLAATVGASDTLRLRIESVALWNAAFSVCLLALFALGLPLLLRNTWDTVPLAPGPERAVLEAVASRAGFRCREIGRAHV